MRKKRTSKRRWKKRCLLRMVIPYSAIVEHHLERWFTFEWIEYELYRVRVK
jgi:hypothetical protein